MRVLLNVSQRCSGMRVSWQTIVAANGYKALSAETSEADLASP